MQFDIYNHLNIPEYAKLDNARSKKNTAVFGALPSEKIFLAGGLRGFVLYVTFDYVSAQSIVRQLNAVRGDVVYLPYAHDVLTYKQSLTNNYIHQRNTSLNRILNGCSGAVVCVDALTQLYPDKATFAKKHLVLAVNKDTRLDKLSAQLVALSYVKTDKVTAVGEFAIRGDIVDVFSPTYEMPVRISFFGDTVESIKLTDVNMRGTTSLDRIELFDIGVSFSLDALSKATEDAKKQPLDSNGRARINTILSELELTHSDWLAPYLKHSSLSDYLPDDTIIVWDEPKLITDKLNANYADHSARFERLLTQGEVLPKHIDQMLPYDTLFFGYENFGQISLQQLAYANTFFHEEEVLSLKSTPLFVYKFNVVQLADDVRNWLQNGYQILIFGGSDADNRLLQAALHEGGASVGVAIDTAYKANEGVILPLDLEHGFVSHGNKLAVIGYKDLVHKATVKEITKTKQQVFLAVSAGDYVVHEQHGIGLCEGIQTLHGTFGTKDFVVVKYRNDDRVYVPVESSNLLSRFSGAERAPVLSKIGGGEFERVKGKVKASIKEMSIDLLKLYAERENKRGFTYQIDSYLCNEFSSSFEFIETPDQLKCIREIDEDLSKDKIMDRLLVGDVGFGKTEVALRTAFKVIANGYQVALMAPTTILSQQHYETAIKRMSTFDIKVECLNRFRTTAEVKQILERLRRGEVDLLIGTHKLLGKEVVFNKLGMLILDEEQRFGVEHKEKLKLLRKNVDVLTLSATPIPRTLHMALTGMRDISTISTPPTERIPVETFVIEENLQMIRDIIIREMARGGQIFFVYNKVESIDLFSHKISKVVPEARIIVAHGQMDGSLLEKSIYDFSKGKYDVLICSTIIENGIDMPNANTLIVYDADKLGLSQLYQLRGRVGRSDKMAYAYFVYPENKIMSEVAYKRLNSIMEYSALGSGFKIAMADLEIRGAGTVLGREQHGHLEKVGYEMYARLLKETMSELKGEKVLEQVNATVDVDVDAYAPDDYIADAESRMTLYQKAASITTIAERDELIDELKEIYGQPPEPISNLLTVVTIKMFAGKSGIDKVTILKNQAVLHFKSKEYLVRKKVFDAISQMGRSAKIDSADMSVVLTMPNKDKGAFVDNVIDFLTKTVLDDE